MTHLRPNGNVLDRRSMTDIEAMYREPLPSSRTGALYNAFSYPTKISPEVIALFIATHTSPGETVLDTFSGSGTTGLATLLCDQPTDQMLGLANKLDLRPKWGARHAHLVEVGTLGCFVASVMTAPPDPIEFREAAARLISRAREQLCGLYQAVDPDGEAGEIRHVIWSEVITCPKCGAEHRLWDVAVQRQPAVFRPSFVCSSCTQLQRVDACERVMETSHDVFGNSTSKRLRVPVEVHGTSGTRKWRRPTSSGDGHIDGWKKFDLPDSAPDVAIEWGELRRSGYHVGIDALHQFYTPRNFLAMATCLEIASKEREPMASALKFLILSYNASHATLMSRIVAKKGQPDFVLTGAQSGVLYVSGLPVEKNVLVGIQRKAKVISNAFELVHGSRSSVMVHNASSEWLPLKDATIDYVFTDPPFGDYIPYAELNQINELWLPKVTDRAAETVVSKSGRKDADHYEKSMTRVFFEIHRVLKPDGRATVVFHSARARIWQALTRAYVGAGFSVSRTSILDKIQASFKQVVSTVSVKGDPLILLEKGKITREGEATETCFLKQIERDFLEDASSDVRPYFSRYIAECLAADLTISLDASAFARRLSPKEDAS